MFWVSWGQVWCSKYRDAALKKQGGNTQRYWDISPTLKLILILNTLSSLESDKDNFKELRRFNNSAENCNRSRLERTRRGGTGFSGPCQTTRTLRGTSTVRWDPPWTPRRSAKCGSPSWLPEMWYTKKRVRIEEWEWSLMRVVRHLIKIESAKIATGVPKRETNYNPNYVPF